MVKQETPSPFPDSYFLIPIPHVLAVLLVAGASGVYIQGQPDAWPVLAFACGVGVAFGGLAYAVRFLNAGGAWAGGLLAYSVVGLGGWAWAVPSFAFFLLSSGLSKIRRQRKAVVEEVSEKGSRRDAAQVYANGGVGWVLLLGYVVQPEPLLYGGFLGAFAAAAADTWGTEIGALARSSPRLITTGRRVPPGTSGAVSGVGTVASVLGAAVVAGAAVPFGAALVPAVYSLAGSVIVGGVVGAIVDSLIGATLQARFIDPATALETERAIADGVVNEHVRGWRWLRNDHVNLLCTLTGAIVAMTCFRLVVFAS